MRMPGQNFSFHSIVIHLSILRKAQWGATSNLPRADRGMGAAPQGRMKLCLVLS